MDEIRPTGIRSGEALHEPVDSPRIVLVEDDPDITAVLSHVLTREGYAVDAHATGASGLGAISRRPPALLLLDLHLPDMDGLDVFREVKRESATASTPVIIVSARTEEVDRIVGLSLGADDYVTKPFNPRELILRIRAVLRPRSTRCDRGARPTIRVGSLLLYPAEHLLETDGREIVLTPTEARLLRALMERPGRVQTREALIDNVWGGARSVEARTLDVHVHRLRRKLGSQSHRLETAPGIGYVFRA